MLIKSKRRLSSFLQTLKNGKEVFDFNKIAKSGFPIHLFMTARGTMGKTFNAKEFIREQFQKHGRKSIWLMNSVRQLEREIAVFLEDFFKESTRKLLPKETVDFWRKCKIKGNTENNTCSLYYENEEVIKFLSMNHAELMKGARVGYSYVFYDEHNVKAEVVRDIVKKFDSLIHSLEDLVSLHNSSQAVQIFIFGNNKSLNNKLINNMGIRVLQHEISELTTDDGFFKLALVIAPQYSENQREDIEEANKHNWIYHMSKQLGEHKHSYFNESSLDDINKIERYTDDQAKANTLQPVITVFHKDSFLNVYRKDAKSADYHVIEVDEEHALPSAIMIFNRRDLKDGYLYNTTYKRNFMKLIEANKISYEDITTRDTFISSVSS